MKVKKVVEIPSSEVSLEDILFTWKRELRTEVVNLIDKRVIQLKEILEHFLKEDDENDA